MKSNPRAGRRAGIKTHRSYTVDEVSRALTVAPITVRRWLKDGLPAYAEKKPALILGSDLIAYLDKRRGPTQTCKPYELFCVKCQVPRTPAERMVDYAPYTATAGSLSGICPQCLIMMNRRTTMAKVAALAPFLDVTFVQATPRIKERD